MEKFLFIAAPVQVTDDKLNEARSKEDEVGLFCTFKAIPGTSKNESSRLMLFVLKSLLPDLY